MNKKNLIVVGLFVIILGIVITSIITNNNYIKAERLRVENELLETQGIIALQEYIKVNSKNGKAYELTNKITAGQYINSIEARDVFAYGISTDKAEVLAVHFSSTITEEWKDSFSKECDISIEINKKVEEIDTTILDTQALEVHNLYLNLTKNLIAVHVRSKEYFCNGGGESVYKELKDYSVKVGISIDNLQKYIKENNITHK